MLKKVKSKLIKVAIAAASSLSVAATSICSVAAAKVDLKGGVEKASNAFGKQIKPVFASIFGVMAVVLLGVALIKTIHEFADSRSNERDFNFTPMIKWWAGVVLCGLASSASFFGWFGL